jgi:hypothetical protein
MTADIGILVENYEVMKAAMNNQVLRIVGWIFLRFTEDAAVLRLVRAAIGDVLVSPGAPQSFHGATYVRKSRRILVD